MIVTIDGPAGSGKSTAARKLAARLEIAYLDTGAMYRAIAHAAQKHGVVFSDDVALLEIARSTHLEVDCGPTFTRVRIDGHDVSEAIRSMAVSAVTPHVARHTAIRALLVVRQRAIGRSLGSLVSEGRDQGSVVFPDADVKFVLDATIEKRAHRRLQEVLADGEDAGMRQVMENLRTRDDEDAKQWEPLLEPGRAIVLDTTNLSMPVVVDRLAAHVDECRSKRSKKT